MSFLKSLEPGSKEEKLETFKDRAKGLKKLHNYINDKTEGYRIENERRWEDLKRREEENNRIWKENDDRLNKERSER
jgi:hypothetical protein